MRTVPALLLAGLVAWLVTPAQADPRTRLVIGMGQFPPDMHPMITSTSIKDFILDSALRPMTGFNRRGEVICILCTEVPSITNGRARLVDRPDGSKGIEVTYTLKPDLFWGDGVPVTAADFAFAFQVSRSFAPPVSVDSVTAVDERTMQVTFDRVRYDYDRWPRFPLSEHIEEPIFKAAADPLDYGQKSALNRHPETPGLWMGPYRIAAFQPNESVRLVPNPGWKGAAPHFTDVTMRLIDNTAALQANLLSGDIDMVAPGNLGLTLDQTIALSKTQAQKFDFFYQPAVTSYEHLTVQLDNPLLADRRVRQAMSMAVDRKTITARLFDNRQDPALSFVHPSQAAWDPSVKTWPYDPAAARALLAAAGFHAGADGILVSPAGQRFSVDIVTTAGNRTRELVEQVLQTEFRAVGIELVVKNVPARVMFGETLRKREFTGLVMFQADPALDTVPEYTFSSRWIPRAENNWAGNNYMGYSNPAMDAALAAAIGELDAGKRHDDWKTILDIAGADQPEIDLFFAANLSMIPKWVTGVVHTQPAQWFSGQPTNWIEEWAPR